MYVCIYIYIWGGGGWVGGWMGVYVVCLSACVIVSV